MLYPIRSLIDNRVLIGDTPVGTLRDIVFDERNWNIQYLIVNTGSWFNRKSALIAPSTITQINWDERTIYLSMTQFQFSHSKTLQSQFLGYYHWPYFWTGAGIWGAASTSEILKEGIPPDFTFDPSRRTADQEEVERKRSLYFLRSVVSTFDYRAEALDGEIGYVEDFVFHEKEWKIRHVLVDARTLWPGKSLIFAPEWIQKADWDNLVFLFRFTEEYIKKSPLLNGHAYIDPSFEKKVWDYFQSAERTKLGRERRKKAG